MVESVTLSRLVGAHGDWGKYPTAYEICVYIVVAGEDLPDERVEKFKSVVASWNERHCIGTQEPMRMRIFRKYLHGPVLATQLQSTRRVCTNDPVRAEAAANADHEFFMQAGFHQAFVRTETVAHGLDCLPVTSTAVGLTRNAGLHHSFEFRVKVTGGATHASLVELVKQASTQLTETLGCTVLAMWDMSPGKFLGNGRAILNLVVVDEGVPKALTILEALCNALPKHRLVHVKTTPMYIFGISCPKNAEAAEPPHQ